MSKRTTTRWYIGAWVIYVIVLLALVTSARSASAAASPAMVFGYLVLGIAGILMLVMWIGALIKLGMQSAWGWFVGVLVLHLLGLGIIGMGAYAIAGPEDEDLVVIRPSTPV